MLLLVAVAAQAFELTVPELHPIVIMRLDVVNDLGRTYQVDGEAPFAERLARELAATNAPPSPVVVGATSGVATLATALRMEADEGIGAHRGTLVRPQPARNRSAITTKPKPLTVSKTFAVELVVRVVS